MMTADYPFTLPKFLSYTIPVTLTSAVITTLSYLRCANRHLFDKEYFGKRKYAGH